MWKVYSFSDQFFETIRFKKDSEILSLVQSWDVLGYVLYRDTCIVICIVPPDSRQYTLLIFTLQGDALFLKLFVMPE